MDNYSTRRRHGGRGNVDMNDTRKGLASRLEIMCVTVIVEGGNVASDKKVCLKQGQAAA
jgi:hypothetical protein